MPDVPPDISVVLPVYNQAGHVEDIVKKFAETTISLQKKIEFILVENASTDDSKQVCQRLSETHENIRSIHLTESGWGRAVLAGLEEARGDLLCYTNSARTQPKDLLFLLERALANPGFVVKANRRLRTSIVRRVGSGLYNLQCRTLFQLAAWDVNGTPKVFDRTLYEKLNLRELGDLIDVELLMRCQDLDTPVLDIPIISTVRHGGVSTTNFLSAWKMYSGIVKLWLRSRKT